MDILATILLYLVTAIAVIIGGIYLFYKRKFAYWGSRNMKFVQPSFPFGNIGGMGGKKCIGQVFREVYEQFPEERFIGTWLLFKPTLMLRDPELIRKALIQDFQNFPDHGTYYNEKIDPLGANLFAITGHKWKNLRSKLSPTFTSGKMKVMFEIITDIGKNLQKTVAVNSSQGEPVEAKDIICRYNMDVISSCAFGIESKALKDPNIPFVKMGKKVFEPSIGNLIRLFCTFFVPEVAALFRVTFTPKDVAQYFLALVKDVINYRETNNIRKNDFMDLLLQLKNKGYVDDVDQKDGAKQDKFTIEAASAQAFVFILGGFETSSSVLQFALWEIAKDQILQDRLRTEIEEEMKKSDGELTYEGIYNMKYLSRVLDETLRMYVPGISLMRECVKDYPIPGTKSTIEKGTMVLIPVIGLHYDPKYYPDPEKFDPDRFTEEEKAKRPGYVYLPFGEGPRVCIGQRFAHMQMRVALISLLTKFRIELGKESPKKIEMDPKSFVITPEGGMHLYFKEL